MLSREAAGDCARRVPLRFGARGGASASGQPGSVLLKRSIDVGLALLLLVALGGLMVILALLIRLESPGPAVFAQRRVGYDPRRRRIRMFTLFKFRTMLVDADPRLHEAHIRAWSQGARVGGLSEGVPSSNKLQADPRITRLGQILRRTSLDELPQLWNVLRGDMSLVGPRPVPEYEVARYQPWHRRRLEATPGLTGWWQIAGRGASSLDEMARLDIEYIERRTFWLDLKILLRTIPRVLSCRGGL